MSVFECEQLAQQYADWVRQGIKVEAAGDTCVITSPFLDMLGVSGFGQFWVREIGVKKLLV